MERWEIYRFGEHFTCRELWGDSAAMAADRKKQNERALWDVGILYLVLSLINSNRRQNDGDEIMRYIIIYYFIT